MISVACCHFQLDVICQSNRFVIEFWWRICVTFIHSLLYEFPQRTGKCVVGLCEIYSLSLKLLFVCFACVLLRASQSVISKSYTYVTPRRWTDG